MFTPTMQTTHHSHHRIHPHTSTSPRSSPCRTLRRRSDPYYLAPSPPRLAIASILSIVQRAPVFDSCGVAGGRRPGDWRHTNNYMNTSLSKSGDKGSEIPAMKSQVGDRDRDTDRDTDDGRECHV